MEYKICRRCSVDSSKGLIRPCYFHFTCEPTSVKTFNKEQILHHTTNLYQYHDIYTANGRDMETPVLCGKGGGQSRYTHIYISNQTQGNIRKDVIEMLIIPLYRSSKGTSAMEYLYVAGRHRGSGLLSQRQSAA